MPIFNITWLFLVEESLNFVTHQCSFFPGFLAGFCTHRAWGRKRNHKKENENLVRTWRALSPRLYCAMYTEADSSAAEALFLYTLSPWPSCLLAVTCIPKFNSAFFNLSFFSLEFFCKFKQNTFLKPNTGTELQKHWQTSFKKLFKHYSIRYNSSMWKSHRQQTGSGLASWASPFSWHSSPPSLPSSCPPSSSSQPPSAPSSSSPPSSPPSTPWFPLSSGSFLAPPDGGGWVGGGGGGQEDRQHV